MLGRWLSQSINLIFALVLAVSAMQAPAVTHEYLSTLSQVADAAKQDIEQRKASARQFYSIQTDDNDQFVAALKAYEPSNAETLGLSIEKERALRAAFGSISESRPLLQPITAAIDAVRDDKDYKATIWRGLLASYEVQIRFSVAALIYGLAGLLLGTFVAQLLISVFSILRPGRRAQPG
jgi:DUF2937 family protein